MVFLSLKMVFVLTNSVDPVEMLWYEAGVKAKPEERFSCDKAHMGLNVRKPDFVVHKQQSHRSACASMQSDQHICYSLIGKYNIYRLV